MLAGVVVVVVAGVVVVVVVGFVVVLVAVVVATVVVVVLLSCPLATKHKAANRHRSIDITTDCIIPDTIILKSERKIMQLTF